MIGVIAAAASGDGLEYATAHSANATAVSAPRTVRCGAMNLSGAGAGESIADIASPRRCA